MGSGEWGGVGGGRPGGGAAGWGGGLVVGGPGCGKAWKWGGLVVGRGYRVGPDLGDGGSV